MFNPAADTLLQHTEIYHPADGIQFVGLCCDESNIIVTVKVATLSFMAEDAMA
jgi:hypothetical protein